jgi:hypothetical protein
VAIKSACTAVSRPASAAGLEVRQGRRHSDARTVTITNQGQVDRAVRVEQVARAEGPCSGDWARQTQLPFADQATGGAPGASKLAPGQRLEIQIGPQRVAGSWACTKVGLALWLEVDGAPTCSDVGAWIAAEGGEEEG